MFWEQRCGRDLLYHVLHSLDPPFRSSCRCDRVFWGRLPGTLTVSMSLAMRRVSGQRPARAVLHFSRFLPCGRPVGSHPAILTQGCAHLAARFISWGPWPRGDTRVDNSETHFTQPLREFPAGWSPVASLTTHLCLVSLFPCLLFPALFLLLGDHFPR